MKIINPSKQMILDFDIETLREAEKELNCQEPYGICAIGLAEAEFNY